MQLTCNMKRRFFLALLLSLPLLSVRAADKPKVVSFSTILTEVAERVGGDRVEVTGLVKPGVDPHEFQPKPADLKLVSHAQLILLSAKHMEGYVGKLKEATGTKGALIEVGNQFPSLKMKSEDQKGAVVEDPHWWHSIDNVRRATKVVQDELTKISPADKAAFASNASAYVKELDDLESWVKSEVAKLPRNQRKLVTSHDAFQYFARSFGFTIHPIEGVSPEEQPSSKQVAALIAAIKSEGVKAIFLESIENPKVVKEITRETGVKIGGTLYADGLGEERDASTYVKMYKHNVSTIVSALK
jgi:zinc/manganese transport system substrate-binding protein